MKYDIRVQFENYVTLTETPNVVSPIYTLLSVIRQQMSIFDQFRGWVAQNGQCLIFTILFRGDLPYIGNYGLNTHKDIVT